MAKRLVMLICIMTLVVSPLHVGASGTLTAAAPGINVLELPTPTISNIDPASGIVTLSLPDVDPDINADLRAVVVLLDADANYLELAPEVKVTDPDSINVHLRTQMQAGYIISPEIINNGIKNSGDGDYVKQPELGEPEPPQVVYVDGGKSSTRTRYIIKEATPETVVVEKIVEVPTEVPQEAPIDVIPDPPYSNGFNGIWGSDAHGDGESATNLEENTTDTMEIENKPVSLKPIDTVADISKDSSDNAVSAALKKMIFVALIILSIILIATIILLARFSKVHPEIK